MLMFVYFLSNSSAIQTLSPHPAISVCTVRAHSSSMLLSTSFCSCRSVIIIEMLKFKTEITVLLGLDKKSIILPENHRA